MKLSSITGYVTASEAIELGFTHHGSYYGIPCWIGDVYGDFQVMTKWAPMEYVMTIFHYIEGFMNDALGREPSFMFKLRGKIGCC